MVNDYVAKLWIIDEKKKDKACTIYGQAKRGNLLVNSLLPLFEKIQYGQLIFRTPITISPASVLCLMALSFG